MAIEREMTLNDYINVIKRRLPVVLSVFFVVLLLATAVALKLPSVYESTATILIESQQVQSDPTVTKEKYASDRFEQLKQVVLSNENLYKIA
ncbi:MAG TPA: Wzz/FepE/Etk N-terminal domain-containing protein, partial [Methylophilaceae bacterium]|nr:Wzz/FepE/Etk N-terminal domain-containing protein [Methylophilaceae bacterium]